MHPPIIPDRSPMPSPVQIRILRISFSADLRSVSLYLTFSNLRRHEQNLYFSERSHDGREFPIARTSELVGPALPIYRSRVTVLSYVYDHPSSKPKTPPLCSNRLLSRGGFSMVEHGFGGLADLDDFEAPATLFPSVQPRKP